MSKSSIGKSTGVVIWFATHPDEELSSSDVAIKWDLMRRHVHGHLTPAVRSGLLVVEIRQDKDATGRTSHKAFYKAGPTLLKEINR